MSVAALVEWISSIHSRNPIDGISVLGGEPLEQWAALRELCFQIKQMHLGVIVFTGYEWPQICSHTKYAAVSDCVDTLVDGPFRADELESVNGRAVIGSRNQKLRHFSSRYADSSLWQGPRRVEAVVQDDGRVQLIGAPALVTKLQRHLEGTRAD